MSTFSIQPTYPIFTDIDGQPLEDGYVWVGVANLAPIGNPTQVYWDAALTIPAAQPIRTRGGYPINNGTPARLYVNNDYSIQVQNKNGSVLYSAPQALERYNGGVVSFIGFKSQQGTIQSLAGNDGADWIGFEADGASAVARSAQDKMRDTVSVKDFGAIGNGTADDTAAIQAAIDDVAYTTSGFYGEVTGKILYFPAGVYKISAPLTVPANAGIHFVGEGKTRSTLWQSINDVNIFNVTGNNFRGGFRGMRLTGNQGQVGGVAKAINIGPNGNQIYVEDCWINTVGYAIYGNPTSDSNFLNNVIEYVLTPIYLAGAGNGYFTINDNVFYNCGPVSQGGSEQRASFEFQSTTQCIVSNNRFVSDAAMSPQTGGYIVVNNVNDFLFTENVMSVSSLTAANFIVTNSNKIKLTDNTFPEAWKQQLILNNCTDVVVANNKLAKMKNIGAYGVNLVDVIDVQKLRFIGNTVGEATLYVMHIRTTCEDIVIANNTFDGGANLAPYHTILMQGTNQAVVTGNTFRNGNQGRDFTCDTVTDLILQGNTLDLGFNVDPGFGPTNVYGNVGGATRLYLNTAPSFGTWKQGDIVWFQQPTAGGFVGAVCVADGTPGTWKTFGAITP